MIVTVRLCVKVGLWRAGEGVRVHVTPQTGGRGVPRGPQTGLNVPGWRAALCKFGSGPCSLYAKDSPQEGGG